MKHRTVLSIFTLSICSLALLFAALAGDAQTYVPLYTFPNTTSNTTGVAVPALFSQGPDGDLYSTVQSNGTYNSGTVYKMTTVGGYSAVYNFCAEGGHCLVTGTDPWGGVTLGTDGSLYGTTVSGGACNGGVGTIFKVTPAGAWTKLWDFTTATTCNGHSGLPDEGAPYYAPIQGTDGNFYGVDEGVYAGTYGVFYKITTKGKLTAYPFNYANGYVPNIPTQGTDGNFYGTAEAGGDPTCKCGVVYKATAGGKITALHTFKGYPTDGYRPIGALVQAGDGDFWGTTYEGGANNAGTIFKISASGTYTLVYSFQFAAPELLGQLPVAGLALGSDGNLYGVTERGGASNYGTIFQVTTGGTVTFLHNFCSVLGCSDGIYPQTPLVQHTNGKFYGTASGNSLCCGVFFSFDMGLPPFTRLPATQGKVGATVGFLGQGFTGASSVSFNGTGATSFKVVSDTFLTAKVPVGALTGVVSIVTSTGTLLGSHNFKVLPAVTTLSVSSGTVGTPVTISGSGLTQTTKVTFGGVKATFSVTNDSQIATTVPTGAKTGKVAVTTPGGAASSPTTFTVTP
jgi:uncharacterized repeat protein (TIGR03803 family)